MPGRRRASEPDPREQGEQTVDATETPEVPDTPVGDYPERPYAEALSSEHAEVLRAAGQYPEDEDD